MNSGGPPPDVDDSATVLAELRREARRLGFGRLGVASADPARRPPFIHEGFRRWLDAGLAGATEPWLREHEPLRRDVRPLLEGTRSVIMLATDHATTTDSTETAGRGRVARYAWGDDYHDVLRSRINDLGAWLEARLPGCRTRGFVDSVPFPEREYGWLAGLGWIGKNTLLIDPEAGSFFLLTVLLATADLPPDVPLAVDHCGSCTACLDACPTQALIAPRVLDAARCVSALTIEDHGPVSADLRAGLGDWLFGCDVCQQVCPWNRHAPGSDEPEFQPRESAALDLADLLALDESRFRERFRGTPPWRAKRRGLLRSAAIVLGNRPHAASLEALVSAAADDDAVVRGAAAWALGRWILAGIRADRCRAALHARREVESDEAVRREVDQAIGRGEVRPEAAG
ncbi:MAG: tRNA epoxyqueuosine(34) reductase QueG [Planctomycetia bacterium]|nr:tRNA epoxyqueuosine(34) reductase QueG [Planctomycetia bacterium]